MPNWRLDKLRTLLEYPFAGRGLTERQQELARLAAFGFTIEEIAAEIEITSGGAGSHMRDIKKKIGLGKSGLTRDLVERIEDVLK